MSGEVGGDHDKKKSCSYRQNCYEIGVEADEGTNGEE